MKHRQNWSLTCLDDDDDYDDGDATKMLLGGWNLPYPESDMISGTPTTTATTTTHGRLPTL